MIVIIIIHRASLNTIYLRFVSILLIHSLKASLATLVFEKYAPELIKANK